MQTCGLHVVLPRPLQLAGPGLGPRARRVPGGPTKETLGGSQEILRGPIGVPLGGPSRGGTPRGPLGGPAAAADGVSMKFYEAPSIGGPCAGPRRAP